MSIPKIRLVRYGKRYYIKQESEGDPRGNRYLGPFGSPVEVEILSHRMIAKAKQLGLKEETDEETAA